MKIKYLLLLMAFSIACTKPKKTPKNNTVQDSTKTKKEKANGLVKSYTSDGKLYSAITYKDGIKDGISYAYFSNGQVNLELTYLNGKREGQSKRYYQSGKLYQTTEYKNNEMHGYQKKYRESGQKSTEMKYEKGRPCSGLKEYLLDGSTKKDYPIIIISPIDEVKTKGRFILRISMSNKTKKVKFYEGALTPGGCLNDNLNFIRLKEKTGEGELVYNLPPGGFMMKEINIIAEVKTVQGNSYIIQKKYNLAIDN